MATLHFVAVIFWSFNLPFSIFVKLKAESVENVKKEKKKK